MHLSIGYTPFLANIGHHSRWSMLEHLEISRNLVAESHLAQAEEITKKLSQHLQNAQAAYKIVANLHRLNNSPRTPKFQVGDCVWLLGWNVETTMPCDKLNYQPLGPFEISGKFNDVAFYLDLHHICVFIQCFMLAYWSIVL